MATPAPAHAHAPRIGFGDRLRRLRIDLGMDLREMGRDLDISQPTLSRYELASVDPRNAPHVAASIQLRYGRRYPGLDLRHWLLTGIERSPQPTVSRSRHLAAVAAVAA